MISQLATVYEWYTKVAASVTEVQPARDSKCDRGRMISQLTTKATAPDNTLRMISQLATKVSASVTTELQPKLQTCQTCQTHITLYETNFIHIITHFLQTCQQ